VSQAITSFAEIARTRIHAISVALHLRQPFCTLDLTDPSCKCEYNYLPSTHFRDWHTGDLQSVPNQWHVLRYDVSGTTARYLGYLCVRRNFSFPFFLSSFFSSFLPFPPLLSSTYVFGWRVCVRAYVCVQLTSQNEEKLIFLNTAPSLSLQ